MCSTCSTPQAKRFWAGAKRGKTNFYTKTEEEKILCYIDMSQKWRRIFLICIIPERIGEWFYIALF